MTSEFFPEFLAYEIRGLFLSCYREPCADEVWNVYKNFIQTSSSCPFVCNNVD